MRELLEAKGLIDALGSLSDDEGVENDSEEEEEGEGEDGESGTGEADQSRDKELLEEESPIPKTDDRAPQQQTVS